MRVYWLRCGWGRIGMIRGNCGNCGNAAEGGVDPVSAPNASHTPALRNGDHSVLGCVSGQTEIHTRRTDVHVNQSIKHVVGILSHDIT